MANLAVIVGRFQVPFPTEAHIDLIQHAIDVYDNVIIFIGHSPKPNRLNIVPHNLIKETIEKICLRRVSNTNKKAIVSTIQDVYNPQAWSYLLDAKILELCVQNNISCNNAVALGGRDSFVFSYKGKLLTPEIYRSHLGDEMSASQIRKEILNKGPRNTPEFISGMIYQRLSQYPTAFQTVDIAIENNGHYLLGHREGISKYRFIGGFSDPESNSLEDDAVREVFEETQLEVTDIKYIKSTKINDVRYANTGDSIKTAFFHASTQTFGTASCAEPATKNGFDDMPYLRWFRFEDITENMLVSEHVILFNMLKKYRETL